MGTFPAKSVRAGAHFRSLPQGCSFPRGFSTVSEQFCPKRTTLASYQRSGRYATRGTFTHSRVPGPWSRPWDVPGPSVRALESRGGGPRRVQRRPAGRAPTVVTGPPPRSRRAPTLAPRPRDRAAPHYPASKDSGPPGPGSRSTLTHGDPCPRASPGSRDRGTQDPAVLAGQGGPESFN